VQTLARHATPQLTMNVYARVREERLAQAMRASQHHRYERKPPNAFHKSSVGWFEWEWRRRESNPRPKAFSYSLYTCFSGDRIRLLPTSPVGQGGRLPGLSFAYSSSRRGRMETIPHRDALHHHRGQVMGGRWPVIRRPGLLHNRWRLCGFPLFYEAGGTLGMQL